MKKRDLHWEFTMKHSFKGISPASFDQKPRGTRESLNICLLDVEQTLHLRRQGDIQLHALWFIMATVKLVQSWLAVNFLKKTSLAYNSNLPYLVSYKAKYKGRLQKSRCGHKKISKKSRLPKVAVTFILVYKGCMNLKTRDIPYYFQNFDSFYPLFFSTFPVFFHKIRGIP